MKMLSKFSCVVAFLFATVHVSLANENDAHVEVALRMIGHKVLLAFGDSTSRVLPIQKVDDKYRIEFASTFSFEPGQLVATVDSVMANARISKEYIVEVEECTSKLIVYSYEVNAVENTGIVPCQERAVPSACYSLYITMNDIGLGGVKDIESIETKVNSGLSNYLWIGLFIVVILLILYFMKPKKKEKINESLNYVMVGDFELYPNDMKLKLAQEEIELTSKECDLLLLLYATPNETVEREIILNRVWGDEGDYVGRTLDVFISKLRKKLELDPSIKIANVRGVGYRLVIGLV